MPITNMTDVELGAMVRATLQELAVRQMAVFKANPQVKPEDICVVSPGMVADYQNVQIHQNKLSLSNVKITLKLPYLEVDF